MATEDIEQHLVALQAYIAEAAANGADLDEIRVKKVQLREIQRTIRQLEKKGIPAPEGLKSEKLTLVAALEALEGASGGHSKVYESLIDIVADLGRVCRRLPHKDLYRKSREWRRQVTPADELRKLITTVLREMGGTGKQRDVLAQIQKKMDGRFTEADQDGSAGKNPRWHNNVKRERKRMIEEGLLTPESRRSTWKLAK